MAITLQSAKDAGIPIDDLALPSTILWLDEVTDNDSGRIGYNEAGSTSSRVPGMNDQFPANSGEAMTAAGLLCRTLLGQDPDTKRGLKQHADLILRALPEWDPKAFGCDMYYWYYGSQAMFQMGGTHWEKWYAAMLPVVLESQRSHGHAAGSWDPVGPWGYSGGRVYSTTLMLLCLEAPYRYARVH